MRRIIPVALVLASILFLVTRAVPRISDGSWEVRAAHQALYEEGRILEQSWAMVDRGDLDQQLATYPGLYPYFAGMIRALAGKDAETRDVIEATRKASLVFMLVALLVPFWLLSKLPGGLWPSAIFTACLAIHPETAIWASRAHPESLLLLFNHAALACFALHVDSEEPAWLYAAVVLAGLSAATKLMGVFILAPVLIWVMWSHRAEPRAALRRLLHLCLIFAAVFVVFNPMLFVQPKEVVDGWILQRKLNDGGPGSALGWWTVLVGPSGIGFAGAALAVFGVGFVAVRRKWDGLAVLTAVASIYLLYLVARVRLNIPRFAFLGMWPLMFVGVSALVELSKRRSVASAVVAVPLLLLYFALDWPAQADARADYATQFSRSFSEDERRVGKLVATIARSNPGPVVTSRLTYVPDGLTWRAVQSLDDIPFPGDASAVVIDDALRQAGGLHLLDIREGRAGFSVTATVGERVVYARKNASWQRAWASIRAASEEFAPYKTSLFRALRDNDFSRAFASPDDLVRLRQEFSFLELETSQRGKVVQLIRWLDKNMSTDEVMSVRATEILEARSAACEIHALAVGALAAFGIRARWISNVKSSLGFGYLEAHVDGAWELFQIRGKEQDPGMGMTAYELYRESEPSMTIRLFYEKPGQAVSSWIGSVYPGLFAVGNIESHPELSAILESDKGIPLDFYDFNPYDFVYGYFGKADNEWTVEGNLMLHFGIHLATPGMKRAYEQAEEFNVLRLIDPPKPRS